MEYTNLGKSGCKVSRLCLGTMNFGIDTAEADAHAMLSKALDLGINFWDTADIYGREIGGHVTENIIGRWFAANPGKRQQVVLATKYQGRVGDGINDRGNSAYHMRRAIEASLTALQTDCIDLYQMHHVDRSCHWDELWNAYDVLIKQGKVVYAGSSNFAGWHIAKANESATRHGMLGLVSEQCKLSLLCRHTELEVIPAARDYGAGVIAWSPLGNGMLAGYAEVGKRRSEDWLKTAVTTHLPRIERFAAFCQELGKIPAQVALAWVLSRPGVIGPIIGPRTVAQLESCLGALEIRFTAEQLARLD